MNVAEEWFTKALKLSDGQELIINVQDKRVRTKLVRELKELKDSYALVDAKLASKIDIRPDFKDRLWYVLISFTSITSVVGILRDANGVLREVSIEEGSTDNRKIMLMIKDKLSIEEIEDNLGRELTEEERRIYFGKGN